MTVLFVMMSLNPVVILQNRDQNSFACPRWWKGGKRLRLKCIGNPCANRTVMTVFYLRCIAAAQFHTVVALWKCGLSIAWIFWFLSKAAININFYVKWLRVSTKYFKSDWKLYSFLSASLILLSQLACLIWSQWLK